MARIKITDLPGDLKITREDMKRVRGGYALIGSTSLLNTTYKFAPALESLSFPTIQGLTFDKD